MSVASIGSVLMTPLGSIGVRRSESLDFAQSIASVSAPDMSNVAISMSAYPACDALSTKAIDFNNMTPSQLFAAAKTMAAEGKIGLDDGFRMQMAAGGLDPNAAAYTTRQTPVDYVAYFQRQLEGTVSRGGTGNASYLSYQKILDEISPK